jgi:4-hydroxybutyrate CoA-transferase
LFGQVCADSIGTKHYSGVGGQMDFIRGATLSKGGKAIITLPSQTSKGITRIVPSLKEGASVVTTRAHVQYIVTEYGIADLCAKNLKQRAKEMLNISHPDDRANLIRTIYNNSKILI